MGSDVDPERTGAVMVPLEEGRPDPAGVAEERLASLPFVVVGVTRGTVADGWLELCDVAVAADDPALERITANLTEHPITSATLALLLHGPRACPSGTVWLPSSPPIRCSSRAPSSLPEAQPRTPPAARGTGTPARECGRTGATLSITLTRPQRLNTLDAQMHNEFVEALTLASADPGITLVELRGEAGPSPRVVTSTSSAPTPIRRRPTSSAWSAASGAPWPGSTRRRCPTCTAHPSDRAWARGLHRHRGGHGTRHDDRPARDRARPGARRRGHGQPVPRRIGRLRTAWLTFSGSTIDAATALGWGLVDEVVD